MREPDMRTPTHSDRGGYLWLGVILVLAAVLRALGLDAPLWFDEIVTIDSHVKLPWSEMFQGYSMNSHYLFSLQSKLSAELFGDAIWAYRLPAAIFGVATVAAIWWLARDVAGLAVAHLSALLVALSYHEVWFSQNARGYSELAFWSALAMILYLHGLRRPRAWIWVAWGVVLAAAVFTHLTGAFFFVAQGVVWLIWLLLRILAGRARWKNLLYPLLGAAVGAGLTLALYSPMLPEMLATVGGVSETSAIDVMQEYQNPLWTVLEGVRTAVGDVGALPAAVAVLVLAVAMLGSVRTHAEAPLFAPVVLAHVVLTAVLLQVLGMRIWPRFFFVDIGLVMILVAAGVSVIARGLGRLFDHEGVEAAVFAVTAVAMVAVSTAMLARNYAMPKQDLAGAYQLVEATRKPADRVYVLGPAGPLYRDHFGVDWGLVATPEDYDAALAEDGPEILVVVFPARVFRAFPRLRADTGRDFDLIRRFPGSLGDGSVLVFRRE